MIKPILNSVSTSRRAWFLVALGWVTSLGCARGDATSGAPAVAARPPADERDEGVLGVALVGRIAACWQARSDGDWVRLGACYAEDATLELPGSTVAVVRGRDEAIQELRVLGDVVRDESSTLELVLVDGSEAIAVGVLHGSGFGIRVGQYLRTDGTGRITNEFAFLDTAALLAQRDSRPTPRQPIAPSATIEVAVAREDDAEARAASLAVSGAVDAFNAHDSDALDMLLSDDLLWSDPARSADVGKAAFTRAVRLLWEEYPDLRLTVVDSITVEARGALVAILDGTSATGFRIAVPCLALYRVEDGRVVAVSLVYQSAAMPPRDEAPVSP
jgi:ketosteroid isomerase-like protein